MTKMRTFAIIFALTSAVFAIAQTQIKDSVVLDDLIVTGTKQKLNDN